MGEGESIFRRPLKVGKVKVSEQTVDQFVTVLNRRPLLLVDEAVLAYYKETLNQHINIQVPSISSCANVPENNLGDGCLLYKIFEFVLQGPQQVLAHRKLFK